MDGLVTPFLADAFEAEVGTLAGALPLAAQPLEERVRDVAGGVQAYRSLLEDLARDEDTDPASREILRRIAGHVMKALDSAVDFTRRECAIAGLVARAAHP